MRRALVLGGGGIIGIAWELGVLAGLARVGVDLSRADLIVGTSAGALVGALLATGASPEEAVDLVGDSSLAGTPQPPDPALVAEAFRVMADRSLDPGEARARVGALALAAPLDDPEDQVRRIAARLAGDWPRQPRLLVTAVGAQTGEPVAWDAHSRVPLARAVAASCAVPGVFAPVEVGGRRYVDGGVRSITNADLATGVHVVVVVTPTLGIFDGSPEAELRRLGGVRSVVLGPDRSARSMIGPNVLDASRRLEVLRAGLAQGAHLAPTVRRVWAAAGDPVSLAEFAHQSTRNNRLS